MDAGVVVSGLIEKLKDLLTVFHYFQCFMFEKKVKGNLDNLYFLKRWLEVAEAINEEIRMIRVLRAVYSADDATDAFLMRMEFHVKKEEMQREHEELQRHTEELQMLSEVLLGENEEIQREKEEIQREREELLREGYKLQRGRLKKCTERVKNFTERVKSCRENSEIEESSTEREELQIETEKKVSKQPLMRFKPLCSQILFIRVMKKLNHEVTRLRNQKDIDNAGHDNKIAKKQLAKEEGKRDVLVPEELKDDLLARLIPGQKRPNRLSSESQSNMQDRDPDRDKATQVIAVFGEGGSGKTALVRAVFNRVDVKKHFTNRAWVRASIVFKARHVLIDILKQINPAELVMAATFSEEELKKRVSRLLKDSRYLIIIDDVETTQLWIAFRDALCSSSPQGSRIIVITRHRRNVPLEAYSLRVRRMNNEKTWKLFLKEVKMTEVEFKNLSPNNSDKSPSLKEQILTICGGLPLRFVLLGGLLNMRERNYDEYSKVIARALRIGGDVLDLSYQDLPLQVKPCFLHMLLFPRAFEIPTRRLIHLWCAEGFVTSSDDREESTEDVAQGYIRELVQRSMIQAKWKLDGSPKTSSIANVLHDAFYEKAADVGFVYHQLHSSSTQQPHSSVRRLAAYLGTKNFPSYSFLKVQNLRSYVAFDTRIRGTATIETSMFNNVMASKGLKLLKTLDLEGVYMPRNMHIAVRKLIQLRYIGLRSTFLDNLPDSVGELPYLETLDLKHTRITDIYSQLWNAKKLQHLYLNWINEDQNLPPTSLSNLRTLWGLRLTNDYFVNEFLGKLTGLRKLGLTCDVVYGDSVTRCVSQVLTKLQSIKLKFIDVGNPQQLKISTHDKLKDLYLRARLEKSSILAENLPPNLRILSLSMSRLEEDPMPLLGKLTQLKFLRLLAESYMGKEMKCHPKDFPQLRVLKLWRLKINYLTFEKGAMPCLEEIEIRSCPVDFIAGSGDLTTLKQLVFTNMSSAGSLSRLVDNKKVHIEIREWDSSRRLGRSSV